MNRKDIDLDAVVDKLQAHDQQSVGNLRAALGAYLQRGEKPDLDARFAGAFAYPELRIHYQ
ncbi:hypothetical protein ABTM12_19570, partial [Acinetobacter baumannii]